MWLTTTYEDKDNLVGRHQALLNPLYVGLPVDDVNGGTANEARAAARTAYMELRLMQANGIAKLTNFKQSLRKSWYNIKG